MIRPPDPAIVGPTLRYMAIGSAEATRQLMPCSACCLLGYAVSGVPADVASRGASPDALPTGAA